MATLNSKLKLTGTECDALEMNYCVVLLYIMCTADNSFQSNDVHAI